MSVDVCYVLSHGFAARMILHSNVIPELKARGLSVIAVLPGADEPALTALGDRLGVRLIAPPPVGGRIVETVRQRARPYFLEDIAANPALRAKHDRSRAQHPLRRALPDVPLWVNRALRRAPQAAAGFSRAERWMLSSPSVAAVLAEHRPRVLVATYPVNALEGAFLREAERAGIPTVGHLLSWDNITAKGHLPVPPQRYLSWGPIMSAELRERYRPGPDAIDECGVPHFDMHVSSPSRSARDAILEALGLDPSRPYLFFGMSSPYFAPHEIDVVEWLAARVNADAFGPEIQLVVRPHPQNVQGHMADQSWLPRLARLSGPRVGIDYPSLEDSSLRWAMKEEDLPHLANLLAGCSICLNSGSTLSIDAIVHDKPVILTAFDADRALPWWKSARRVLEYAHLAKLVALGGVRPTSSFAELEDAITRYLADPTRDRDGRRRTRAEECGPCDGRASERVADALHHLLNGTARPAQPAKAVS